MLATYIFCDLWLSSAEKGLVKAFPAQCIATTIGLRWSQKTRSRESVVSVLERFVRAQGLRIGSHVRAL